MDLFPFIFPVHPWPRQPDGKTPWFSADPRHHDQKPEIFPGHDVILRHRDGHDLGVRCQADQIGGWMWRHTDLYHIWFRFKSEAGLKPFWEDSALPASRVPGDTEGKAWVLTVAFILRSEKSHHASSSMFFCGPHCKYPIPRYLYSLTNSKKTIRPLHADSTPIVVISLKISVFHAQRNKSWTTEKLTSISLYGTERGTCFLQEASLVSWYSWFLMNEILQQSKNSTYKYINPYPKITRFWMFDITTW